MSVLNGVVLVSSIRQSHADGRSLGDAIVHGCELRFRHDRFFDQQARDNHERGWTGTFAKLDAFLLS